MGSLPTVQHTACFVDDRFGPAVHSSCAMKKTLLPVLCLFAVGIVGLGLVYTVVLQPYRRSGLANVFMAGLGVVLLILVTQAVWRLLGEPEESSASGIDEEDEPIAHCLVCLSPMNPHDHFCAKCGPKAKWYMGWF